MFKMMKSSSKKMLMDISWLMTALGSTHIGLKAIGYDFLSSPALGGIGKFAEYGFGIFGVMSLAWFIMYMMGQCSSTCGS